MGADGHFYVAGGCDVTGAKFAGVCLFRAMDSTLSKFVLAGGSDSVFFKVPRTLGAIDANGVFHNKSYPLDGLDVGCPDLFPCGDKFCMILSYGGTPGGPNSHMQNQWWSGQIKDNVFLPEETDLFDYGDLFAAKTGTVEQQTGTSRRVLFGFPGWTQTTKPRAAPRCLQFAREVTLVDNRLRSSPIPEMSLLRRKPTSCD